MIRSWFQSGTHIAERICWIRIDCPASNRPSARASDVRTATRFWMTDSTMVWEKISPASPDSFPRCRASIGTSRSVVAHEDDDGPVDGKVLEEEVDDPPEDLLDLAREDERLGDLDQDLEDLAPRDGRGRPLPGLREGVAFLLRDVVLEVEVAVEVGDRPDERGRRVADALHRRLRPHGRHLLPDGEREGPDRQDVARATIGEEATNRPLTFTPFVEFWSTMTQRSFSCRITAWRRETEKSFRTTSFSLDLPRKTSGPVSR